MKKTIRGRTFDTDTAERLGTYRDSNCIEVLFRKRTGEFFIYGRGNAESDYAKWGKTGVVGSEQIITLTPKQAQKWARLKLSAVQYNDLFGSGADNQKQTISLSLPVGAIKALKNAAGEQGRTSSAIIAELILQYLRD